MNDNIASPRPINVVFQKIDFVIPKRRNLLFVYLFIHVKYYENINKYVLSFFFKKLIS
jgi:hypothetical protein